MAHSAYYNVRIHTGQGDEFHTVCATSDYAAARRVRALTGYMAARESDVMCLSPQRFPFSISTVPTAAERAQTLSPPSPASSGAFRRPAQDGAGSASH